MQIQINIEETLYEYYQKVKGKTENIYTILSLPVDIRSSCPICGGTDCVQFICYYTRIVIDEKGRCYTDFPIARFLCKSTDRTCSLLPQQLVPYCKYSIELILTICKLAFSLEWSITEVLDYLENLAEDNPLSTSGSQVQRLEKLFKKAKDKILATCYYPEFTEKSFQENKVEQIKNFIKFAEEFKCVKVVFEIKGVCGLGHDFYLSGGSYFKNAQFLFGVASQFRGS